jgi:hydroxyacylglutathione hydrolase
MGFHELAGHLTGGMLAWHSAGLDSQGYEIATVPQICRRLDRDEGIRILDVRRGQELADYGEIPGAQHIPLTQLPGRLDEVPRGRKVHVFCGTGLRSTVGASILQRHGLEDVAVIQGGFRGWASVRCPVRGGERAAAGARA